MQSLGWKANTMPVTPYELPHPGSQPLNGQCYCKQHLDQTIPAVTKEHSPYLHLSGNTYFWQLSFAFWPVQLSNWKRTLSNAIKNL